MRLFSFLGLILCATQVRVGYATVVELTSENWVKTVVQSQKHTFVKFFAPWCGHCKKLKPDWDELGKHFEKDSSEMPSSSSPLRPENTRLLFFEDTNWLYILDIILNMASAPAQPLKHAHLPKYNPYI